MYSCYLLFLPIYELVDNKLPQLNRKLEIEGKKRAVYNVSEAIEDILKTLVLLGKKT